MKPGLVSVIIPALNAAQTLALCLDALERQTYADIEVLLVDNGSIDETVTLATTRGLRVLHAGGRSPTARNVGSRAARGEWLLHIDADMELAPDAIMQCVAAAHAGAEIVTLPERNVAHGYWMRAFSFGKELKRGAPGFEYGRFVARHIFTQIGGYDETLHLGEDCDMHLRMLAAGARLKGISALTSHHVEHLTIGDIWGKTANYARTRRAFTAKHSRTVIADRTRLPRLVVARWRLLAASPLRAAGWLMLTALLVVRDAVLVRSLRQAAQR